MRSIQASTNLRFCVGAPILRSSRPVRSGRKGYGSSQSAFGWKFTDWGGPFTYLLATTGDKSDIGIDGAIMDRIEHGQGVINTISVDKWESGADAVKKAGGQ